MSRTPWLRLARRAVRHPSGAFAALAMCGALAVGCGGGPPTATPADAARANVALEELQRGRSLLVSQCGGCHRPPLPSEYPAREWPSKLDEMAERSNLDAGERRVLLSYLVAMSPP